MAVARVRLYWSHYGLHPWRISRRNDRQFEVLNRPFELRRRLILPHRPATVMTDAELLSRLPADEPSSLSRRSRLAVDRQRHRPIGRQAGFDDALARQWL